MGIPLSIVDAFTNQPFSGNPAAVCLLDGPQSSEWMQSVAAEMNLSETAFLQPAQDGYELRWFTPEVEVDLCGHATLASAHVLWEITRTTPAEPIRFYTRSGLLTAEQQRGWIELDFPALPVCACEPPPGLAEGLGCAVAFVGNYGADYLCEVTDEETLRNLEPDFRRLREIRCRGVVVTCRSEQTKWDFVSRFFAPAVGIAEDPVTGSAHCALGPYWAAKLGKTELVGYQASQRGGTVRVRLNEDRVQICGQAVTFLRGEVT